MISQLACSNTKVTDQSLDSTSYALSYKSSSNLLPINASFIRYSRDTPWDTNLLLILNLNFKGYLIYM